MNAARTHLTALDTVGLTNQFAGLASELISKRMSDGAIVSADEHDVALYSQLKELGLLRVSRVRKLAKSRANAWSGGLPTREATISLTAAGRTTYRAFCACSI